jgi:hypothetical protein
VLGVLALAAPASSQPAPPCLVEVSLEPERAIVGQQVLYRARVWMGEAVDAIEWSVPVAFPHVRTEMLPGDPRPGRAVRAGIAYSPRDELRALFAERSGSLRLAAPDLLCRSAGSAVAVSVPEVVLEVADLPPGAPEGFAGLVGPVVIHQTVTPRELRLGESVRVALMLRGAGNLWALAPPYAEPVAGAELFGQRPRLVLERGRELGVRRHFVYDLVPREPGPLRLPELAIPYFDPQAGRYAVARAPAVTVAVGPRADPAPGRAGGSDPASGVPPTSDRPASIAAWLGAGAVLAIVALGLVLRGRRKADDGVATALRAARSASPDDVAPALERALRAALARHVTDARTVAAEQLRARQDLPEAVAAAAVELAALERSRFDPEAPAPDVAAVERAIAAL